MANRAMDRPKQRFALADCDFISVVILIFYCIGQANAQLFRLALLHVSTFIRHPVDRDGSVDIATRYVLESSGIETRWERVEYSAPIQADTVVHPASYTMCTDSVSGG